MAKLWQRLEQSRLVRNWLGLWLPLIMLALLPVLTEYLKSRYQVSVQDLLIPVITNILTATIVAAIFRNLWRRSPLGGYVGAGLATLLLTNNYESRMVSVYGLIGALNPISGLKGYESPVLSLVFAGFCLWATNWVGSLVARRTQHSKRRRDYTVALLLALIVAFLFQFLPTAQAIAAGWPQFFYHPAKLSSQAKVTEANGKPDIYYIMLDRYASQAVLKQQFNYSNDDFINYLTANGFYTNPEAHQNYPYTTMSIASTLNANYHTDLINRFSSSTSQTVIPYHRAIRDSPVAVQLQKLGYHYNLIGNWYDTSSSSEVANSVFTPEEQLTVMGHQIAIGNFANNLLIQSFYARFLQPGIQIGRTKVLTYQEQTYAKAAPAQLAELKEQISQPAGGRFIFAHILAPHDPYFRNADGSLSANSDNDNIGEPIKQKYLGQVNYINDQMKIILDQIKTASAGKAIVVLQADEGPYPVQLNHETFDTAAADEELGTEDMRTWSDTDLQMKFGNLAAYQLPGVDQATLAANADNVNIFRLVLNNYFADNLPYLPKCYYAYPNGREKPFVYADITERLTGTADTQCALPSSSK